MLQASGDRHNQAMRHRTRCLPPKHALGSTKLDTRNIARNSKPRIFCRVASLAGQRRIIWHMAAAVHICNTSHQLPELGLDEARLSRHAAVPVTPERSPRRGELSQATTNARAPVAPT